MMDSSRENGEIYGGAFQKFLLDAKNATILAHRVVEDRVLYVE
jgi:hypothetical protein